MRRPSEEEIDEALDQTFPASDPPTFAVGDDPHVSIDPTPELAEERMAVERLARCPACGATNRVVLDKLDQGLAPRCGRCRSALTIDTKPTPVTDATFAELVEREVLPVVVDMWAPWCGPCRMLAPILDELADEMSGRIRFAKLNVDENPVYAARFDARRIPLLVIFSDGREVDRIVGLMPKAALAARLAQTVGA